jgi:hypothetical protein
MKVNARTTAAAALAAAALTVAAGCGTSSHGASSNAAARASSAPSSPSAAAPGAAGTASQGPVSPAATGSSGKASAASGSQATSRCHTSMLAAHVSPGQPGAGQRYAGLVLTNTSGTRCQLYGYPGLQLVTATGARVPTAVERQPGSEPLISLAPGQQASSQLHWTVVPGTGEGSPCEPTPSGLIVTPPDETTALHTSWPGGPACQHGQIFVTAFQPGANAT